MKHWPWQHKYETRPVGEYHSVTGPRVIFTGTCSCGKTTQFTLRGEMSYYND